MGWPGSHAGRLRHKRVGKLAPQTLERKLAVSSLRALIGGDDTDNGAQRPKQPRLLSRAKGARRSDIKANLGPRAGRVGVLPAGTAGAAEPPFELGERDHAGSAHPELVGRHSATVAITTCLRRARPGQRSRPASEIAAPFRSRSAETRRRTACAAAPCTRRSASDRMTRPRPGLLRCRAGR